MDRSVEVVGRGELEHISGRRVPYIITNGWDIACSLTYEKEWNRARADLYEEILNLELDSEELGEVLDSISCEDDHWDWFKKAFLLRTKEYEWFHLHADEKVQGACVIYHPKESAFSDGKIFYIEFIAVAPWNRSNALRERIFKGVGRALLIAALRFATGRLKLSPGFCLHSLPGAVGFYAGLEMVKCDDRCKDSLVYFELPRTLAEKLMEVA